jgi:hypothetical protein
MTRIILLTTASFFLSSTALVVPLIHAAQKWIPIGITFENAKDKGILRAEYRTERLKKGCNTTIRLTNTSGREIPGYWFNFAFKEGRGHESRHSDHAAGRSDEWTYSTCGIKSIRISEVEY